VVKRKGEKIESKLETAVQLRSVMINQRVEQARKVLTKIDRAKESRQRSMQQREKSLQDNLDKVSPFWATQKGVKRLNVSYLQRILVLRKESVLCFW